MRVICVLEVVGSGFVCRSIESSVLYLQPNLQYPKFQTSNTHSTFSISAEANQTAAMAKKPGSPVGMAKKNSDQLYDASDFKDIAPGLTKVHQVTNEISSNTIFMFGIGNNFKLFYPTNVVLCFTV